MSIRNQIKLYIAEVCGAGEAEEILSTAELAHKGQLRRSGEPYIEHPIAVANIINKYYPGERLLCTAALLHDTLEDAVNNGNFKDEQELVDTIRQSYINPEEGKKVLSIVYALTHDKSIDYTSYLVELSKNPDALKIKLADMLHNLSTGPTPRQARKYQDAFNALAPDGISPAGIHPDHWFELNAIISPIARQEIEAVKEYVSEVVKSIKPTQ